jgi:hypothetical protein
VVQHATWNPAAVHIDAEYCKGTEFGHPRVNGIFKLGLVIGLSVQETTLGTTIPNLGMTAYRRGLYLTPVATTLALPGLACIVDDCDAKVVIADAALQSVAAALPRSVELEPQRLSLGMAIGGFDALGWGPILLEYHSGSEGVALTLIDSTAAKRRPGSVGRSRKGGELQHRRCGRHRAAARRHQHDLLFRHGSVHPLQGAREDPRAHSAPGGRPSVILAMSMLTAIST